MARCAPRPPSVVAEPPTPRRMRLAPCSRAATTSSPVPCVDAAMGSLPSGPPTSVRPDARAISMTAVRRVSRHPALTGSPSGPMTVVVRFGPPSTSRKPSPPSAMGTRSQRPPAASTARATAAQTSAAVAVPRNLSGATTTRTRAGYGLCAGPRRSTRQPSRSAQPVSPAGQPSRSAQPVGARSLPRSTSTMASAKAAACTGTSAGTAATAAGSPPMSAATWAAAAADSGVT